MTDILVPLTDNPRPDEPRRPTAPSARFGGPIAAGITIIVLFFAGLGGWATYARLDNAAIANGSVVVDSKRKTIQHLEGGIVSDILVHDGDRVTTGQVLVRLDSTQQQSALDVVRSQYETALADAARLKAEQLDQPEITLPPELLARQTDPEVAKLIDAENKIFLRDAMRSKAKSKSSRSVTRRPSRRSSASKARSKPSRSRSG